MDDGVLAFMRAMNEGFPAVETMTAPEARAVIVSRRLPIENFDDVARADDRFIPGPAGDLPVRIYYPHGESAARPAVVFCHGGGFVLCDLRSHDGFCRAMARHTESVVISVDYRLAPEHRAPAAAQDVFAAFCWVVAHAAELGVDAECLVIAGDSAGGNLAGVTALQCREQGGPMPAGQLWRIEKSFRMSKHDLQARPIYHHKRESIDAHLTIVFAAMAVSHWIEHQTGRSIKKFPHRTPLPNRPHQGR